MFLVVIYKKDGTWHIAERFSRPNPQDALAGAIAWAAGFNREPLPDLSTAVVVSTDCHNKMELAHASAESKEGSRNHHPIW